MNDPNPKPDGWTAVDTPLPTETGWSDVSQTGAASHLLQPRQDYLVDDVNQSMTKTDTPRRQWFEAK